MKKRIGLLLCLCTLMCAGCADKSIFVTSFDKRYLFALGDHRVTVGAYQTVLLDVQRQYEAYYGEMMGEEIWSRETEDGETFAEYVKQNVVLDELVTLEVLQVAAEELNLQLTEEEQTKLEEAAECYMSKVDAATVAYTRMDLEQIQELMGKYCLAEKVIGYYADQADLEVSGNEARAIRIQTVTTAEEETAEEILSHVKAGDSFLTAIEPYDEIETKEYNVVRGELTPELEEAAFALAQGECSDVMETEDGYCLLYCVNDYLEDMTQSNKEAIVSDRIYQAWYTEAKRLREELPLYLSTSQWKRVKLAGDASLQGYFFETYQEWFPLTMHMESDQ